MLARATDPEHRDASVLVLCLLDASKFVVDFVEILTELGTCWYRFTLEIHSDTFCVANEHFQGHFLRDECRQVDNALQRKVMLKKTTLYNVNLHLHVKFESCRCDI